MSSYTQNQRSRLQFAILCHTVGQSRLCEYRNMSTRTTGKVNISPHAATSAAHSRHVAIERHSESPRSDWDPKDCRPCPSKGSDNVGDRDDTQCSQDGSSEKHVSGKTTSRGGTGVLSIEQQSDPSTLWKFHFPPSHPAGLFCCSVNQWISMKHIACSLETTVHLSQWGLLLITEKNTSWASKQQKRTNDDDNDSDEISCAYLHYGVNGT